MSDRDELTELLADLKQMCDALGHLATYVKDPPEMVKDEFAYDRLLDYVHRVAEVGLGSRETT